MQRLPMPPRPTLTQFGRVSINTPILHNSSNILPGIPALEPRPVEETKVSRTRRFAREPEPVSIRAQILMHLECSCWRPV